jgi:C4-dicarboxylate-specific signal transduction histidine kinase
MVAPVVTRAAVGYAGFAAGYITVSTGMYYTGRMTTELLEAGVDRLSDYLERRIDARTDKKLAKKEARAAETEARLAKKRAEEAKNRASYEAYQAKKIAAAVEQEIARRVKAGELLHPTTPQAAPDPVAAD